MGSGLAGGLHWRSSLVWGRPYVARCFAHSHPAKPLRGHDGFRIRLLDPTRCHAPRASICVRSSRSSRPGWRARPPRRSNRRGSGIACGDDRWLIRLADAGEVIAVPPIVPVPITQPWFLGLANIRGKLYSVIDFPAFLAGTPVTLTSLARLILLAARGSDQRAGIVVTARARFAQSGAIRADGRRGRRAGVARARWRDADGNAWQEIDLAQLARDPAFLQVGA